MATLERKIITFTEILISEWYQGGCRKHKLFFLKAWLRIRIFYAIKWISLKNKEDKKKYELQKNKHHDLWGLNICKICDFILQLTV